MVCSNQRFKIFKNTLPPNTRFVYLSVGIQPGAENYFNKKQKRLNYMGWSEQT